MTVGDEKSGFHSREGPEQSQGHNDSDDDIHNALPLHLSSPYVDGKKACVICRPGVSERPAAPARQIIHRKILLDTITQYCVIVCKLKRDATGIPDHFAPLKTS